MKRILLLSVVVLLACNLWAVDLPPRQSAEPMKKLTTAERRSAPHFSKPDAVNRVAPKAADAPESFFEVPFTHTLGKGESNITSQYLAFDVNEDTKTWKVGGFTAYSVCMRPESGVMDDWMISPAVHLLAGKTYTMSVQFCSVLSAGTEEKLAIGMGGEQTVEAMTVSLVPLAVASQGKNLVDVVKNFSVEADGYYYFGFHAMSDADKSGNMKLCNFSIEDESERVDPPAAGEIAYQLGAAGALKATITYTAPVKTVSNADLAVLDSVQVSVNYRHVLTLTDVNPGDVKVFDVDVINNYNVVEAVGFVKDVAGAIVATPMFFAGADNPRPVTNVKAVLSADGKRVTLSWDAVGSVGENGGYVDVDNVTYYVFDAFGSIYDDAIAVTNETSVEFDYSDVANQDFMAYEVTAGVDDYYYSLGAKSNIVVIGEPDALPFNESFASKATSKMWMLDPATDYEDYLVQLVGDNELPIYNEDEDAETEYINSHDADNGFLLIIPMRRDAMYGMSSVKIDVSKAEKPVLEFFYQGKGSTLDVLVADANNDFEVLKTIDLMENPTDGWTLCRVDLSDFKQAAFVFVELRLCAIHNTDDATWSVLLDNLRVRDFVESDLRLASLNVPAKVAAGESVNINATIENLGSDIAEGAVLEVRGNGISVNADVPALPAASVVTVNVKVPTNVASAANLKLTAAVKWDADMEPANDIAEADVEVEFSEFPAPENVVATADAGVVSLSWNVPDYSALTQSSTRFEDFEDESYTPLTITDFGGWTLYDGDGTKTYTFLSDYDNPYRTYPMAFQLYDPAVAGVPEYYRPDCAPYSGNRLLMGFSTNDYNDNWLISPVLSGKEQTISFYGRSFTEAFPEEFEVLYSTTDTRTESFTAVESVGNYPDNGVVPEEWTKFSAVLPEGAKYFAIHHTAYDSYALMLDDFTFECSGVIPADTELLGYNIYRNGVKVNEALVTEPGATDTPDTDKIYEYSVSAVYNHGESRASLPVIVDVPSGVKAIGSGDLRVAGESGAITVHGVAGAGVSIYTASGALVASESVADNARFLLPAGIYLVRINGISFKVPVK